MLSASAVDLHSPLPAQVGAYPFRFILHSIRASAGCGKASRDSQPVPWTTAAASTTATSIHIGLCALISGSLCVSRGRSRLLGAEILKRLVHLILLSRRYADSSKNKIAIGEGTW